LACDRVRGAHARRHRVLAAQDRLVPFDGARPVLLLLGDLAQRVAHAVGIAVAQVQQALHVRLRDRVVLDLQREQADGVDGVGVLRVARDDLLELGARLGQPLVAGEHARVGHTRLARRRMRRQERLQALQGLRGGAPLQQLSLEDRRQFPVGLQVRRRAHFGERGFFLLGGRSGLRHGKARLRQLRVDRRKALDQAKVGGRIRIGGQQSAQLQEQIRGDGRVRGHQPGQDRLGFLGALLRHQQLDQRLHCLCRDGVHCVPDLRGLEREVRHPRETGDLHRALRDSRVARLLRQVDVGLRRQCRAAALCRDLAHQELVQHRGRQVLLRQVRPRCRLQRRSGPDRRCVVIVVVVRVRQHLRARHAGGQHQDEEQGEKTGERPHSAGSVGIFGAPHKALPNTAFNARTA
jgi:hypothetical protein